MHALTIKQTKELAKAAGRCVNVYTAEPKIFYRKDVLGAADGEIVFSYPLSSCSHGNVISGRDLEALTRFASKILKRPVSGFWVGIRARQFEIWSVFGDS